MKEKLQRMEAKLDRWGEALDQKTIRYPSDLVTGILFLVLGIHQKKLLFPLTHGINLKLHLVLAKQLLYMENPFIFLLN